MLSSGQTTFIKILKPGKKIHKKSPHRFKPTSNSYQSLKRCMLRGSIIADKKKIIPDHQYDFCNVHGTIDQVYTLVG